MIFLFILSGLWLGLYLSHDYVVYGIISIFLVVFIFKKYKKKFCILFITALAAGFSLSLIKIDNVKDFYKGVVIESKENYFLFSSSFEKFYVYEKANDKEVGDILSISGEKNPINFSSIESGFDFTNYLNDKGVIYELDNPSIEILFKTPFAFKRTRNNFLSHFSTNNKSLVSSLLFGYGEDSFVKDKLSSYHLYRLILRY